MTLYEEIKLFVSIGVDLCSPPRRDILFKLDENALVELGDHISYPKYNFGS